MFQLLCRPHLCSHNQNLYVLSRTASLAFSSSQANHSCSQTHISILRQPLQLSEVGQYSCTRPCWWHKEGGQAQIDLESLGIQPDTAPLFLGVRDPLIEPNFLILTNLALLSARGQGCSTLFLCFLSGNILNVLVRLNSTSFLFQTRKAG